MKTFSMKKVWYAFSVLVFATLACKIGGGEVTTPTPVPSNSSTTPTDAPTTAGVDRDHLIQSTVLVNMEIKQGNEFVIFGSGSGTIISADGLILTNAHVASPTAQGDPKNEPDRLTIAITQSEDQPPVLSYVAEVLAVDGILDLAVLQITSTLNGSSVNPSDLNLPFVEPGDSDNVHIGEHLNIFGFPGVGFDTITYTEGSVAGFLTEDPVGERAWIKTAANVAHGNSGGLAANDAGQIIAIPTAVLGDCDQADTNGDGQIDTCTPNGNSINFLRPIKWATPLIEAAKNNKQYTSPYPAPGVATSEGSGSEALSDFVWVEATFGSEICEFGDTIQSYPAEADCIATAFNYAGMTNGEQFQEVWFLNGENVGEYTYNWEWDADGLFASYLPNGGDPMPEGTYRVELYAGSDLHKIGEAPEIAVGDGTGGGTSQPSQEDTVTVYGVIFDADTKKPINGAYVFVAQGVTYEEWHNKNFDEKYLVIPPLQVGETGEYEITGVPRDIPFTYVFSAEGYYNSWLDDAVIPVDDPARRFELNAEMSK